MLATIGLPILGPLAKMATELDLTLAHNLRLLRADFERNYNYG